MADYYDILKEAIFTERSTMVAEKENVYTFRVNPSANKVQIKEAVEAAFKVQVKEVRTINVRSKRKFDRYRGIVGKTSKYKKALVKLADGHSIEFA